MVSAEKVDAAPIGAGTRFRSLVRSGRRLLPMLIEITDYDRPRRLATATTMARADITYVLNFEPVPAGTRMSWSGQVRPKGALRLLGPLITRLLAGLRRRSPPPVGTRCGRRSHRRRHGLRRGRLRRLGRMRRGEIATVAGGLYANKPWPALIVQDDRFDATDSVTVCPFTTTEIDAPLLRVPVVADEGNGLGQDSYLMVDKITTIRRSNVHTVLGRLEATTLVEFERRLLVFLGFGA